jgi:hypothetical protein
MAVHPLGPGPVRLVATSASRVIAICGKCGKKLGGGFGEGAGRPLGKMLRRTVPGTKGKRATLRIVETKCLDICPKGAVALLDSAQPGAVVIVARATPVAVVVARLGLGV